MLWVEANIEDLTTDRQLWRLLVVLDASKIGTFSAQADIFQ